MLPSEQMKISGNMLQLLKRLECMITRLDKQGIVIRDLENFKFELIHTLFDQHGISRNDEALDWLCEPVFAYLEADGGKLRDYVANLHIRLTELKTQRQPAGA